MKVTAARLPIKPGVRIHKGSWNMHAKLMAVLTIACFLLSVPVISLADNHEEKGKAGGKAGEHRSENAEERSNAQWQDDANKGK